MLVDSCAQVRQRLQGCLQAEGMMVDSVPPDQIPSTSGYDLAFVEEEFALFVLPSTHALVGEQTPIILLSRDRSAKLPSSNQLKIVDTISLPMDSQALLSSRLKTIASLPSSMRFFNAIVGDLKKAIWMGNEASSHFSRLSTFLIHLKKEQGRRPGCTIVSKDTGWAEAMQRELLDQGISCKTAHENHEASSGLPPMVTLVALDAQAALSAIETLRTAHPDRPLVLLAASDHSPPLEEAMQLGAYDFILESEALPVGARRITRIVSQARRNALYLQIIAHLTEAATRSQPQMKIAPIFCKDFSPSPPL